MSEGNAVDITVCLSLIRSELAGYRGYPHTEAGEKRFAEALQLNCVSVGHVREVLKCFDEEFPTVKQIHDTAMNLRPRFAVARDQSKQWQEQYGAPQSYKVPPDEMAMHWQAFREILYYTEGPAKGMQSAGYWEEARMRALDPKQGNHADSIEFVRRQAQEMGWEQIMKLSASPVPFPYTNLRRRARTFAAGPSAAGSVTQEDIARAIEGRTEVARKTTADVDREMESDSWDDPDR